jgi:hypothetical protein
MQTVDINLKYVVNPAYKFKADYLNVIITNNNPGRYDAGRHRDDITSSFARRKGILHSAVGLSQCAVGLSQCGSPTVAFDSLLRRSSVGALSLNCRSRANENLGCSVANPRHP